MCKASSDLVCTEALNRALRDITSSPWSDAQLACKCPSRPHLGGVLGILTNKVGHSWFLVFDQGPLVGLCTQDYKSLCAAVTICSSLVSIPTPQTYTQTDSISSASWAKTTGNVWTGKAFTRPTLVTCWLI